MSDEEATLSTEQDALVAIIAKDVRENGLGPDLPRWSARIAEVIEREYVAARVAEAKEKAWDECARHTFYLNKTHNVGSLMRANPYRRSRDDLKETK